MSNPSTYRRQQQFSRAQASYDAQLPPEHAEGIDEDDDSAERAEFAKEEEGEARYNQMREDRGLSYF